MVSSEFVSMSILYDILPDNVAEPIAWGAYADSPDTYFLAFRFLTLQSLPTPKVLIPLVAKLHRVTSPKENFGSERTTYGGRNPQFFPPSTTWEESFSRGLSSIFDLEEEIQGPDEGMRGFRDGLMARVIPRLLRPLETGGRVLVPRLVHGDLWAGNAAVDAGSERAIIFDAVPLFAHRECKCRPVTPYLNVLGDDRGAFKQTSWTPGGLRWACRWPTIPTSTSCTSPNLSLPRTLATDANCTHCKCPGSPDAAVVP